jgi:hypothetical protein
MLRSPQRCHFVAIKSDRQPPNSVYGVLYIAAADLLRTYGCTWMLYPQHHSGVPIQFPPYSQVTEGKTVSNIHLRLLKEGALVVRWSSRMKTDQHQCVRVLSDSSQALIVSCPVLGNRFPR